VREFESVGANGVGGHLKRENIDEVLDRYLDDFKANNQVDFMALHEALEHMKAKATVREYDSVRLHYLLGYKQKELAELFGVTPSAISKDLRRAIAKLSLELRAEHDS
jgi:RNA polymerase sigma factor (sigma-70 family)